MEDAELPLKLGRRRSRRIASSGPPICSDLGKDGGARLSTISEIEGMEGVPAVMLEDAVGLQTDSCPSCEELGSAMDVVVGVLTDDDREEVRSGSPILSLTAAVLSCQVAMASGGRDLFYSLSSSLLDADVRGDFGSLGSADASLNADFGAFADDEDGAALTDEGDGVGFGGALVVEEGLDGDVLPHTQTAVGGVLPAIVIVSASSSQCHLPLNNSIGGQLHPMASVNPE
ncbi:hypothetical protein Dimus_022472 [Dionaea muscipula]